MIRRRGGSIIEVIRCRHRSFWLNHRPLSRPRCARSVSPPLGENIPRLIELRWFSWWATNPIDSPTIRRAKAAPALRRRLRCKSEVCDDPVPKRCKPRRHEKSWDVSSPSGGTGAVGAKGGHRSIEVIRTLVTPCANSTHRLPFGTGLMRIGF